MDQVELIINGRVTRQLKLADDILSASLDGVVRLDTTGWMTLRARGKSASLLTAPGLWAHTSPVYIDIPNRPMDAKADAAYFLKWINRLEADLRKRNRIPGVIDQHVKSPTQPSPGQLPRPPLTPVPQRRRRNVAL